MLVLNSQFIEFLIAIVALSVIHLLFYHYNKHLDDAVVWKLSFPFFVHPNSYSQRRPPRPPFFAVTCFFCNHFEELETVLFEVELIINNKPLTYVYPNTIETPNHLLFGIQLLYSSNTTSTVVRNLAVPSTTTDKINRISNHVLDRWRHVYVVKLRETQRTSKLNINSLKILLILC